MTKLYRPTFGHQENYYAAHAKGGSARDPQAFPYKRENRTESTGPGVGVGAAK